MNGITITERSGRYRVLQTWPGGGCAQLGIFRTPAEAIAYATELVLEHDTEGATS